MPAFYTFTTAERVVAGAGSYSRLESFAADRGVKRAGLVYRGIHASLLTEG